MSNLISPPERLAPLFLACLMASPAFAQADEVAQLDAITVAGQKYDEVAKAREALNEVPGGTNLVDMQQVEQGRVVGVAAVLAYQPGVYAQSPGNEGVKISIRGSGINRGPGAHASGNHILLDGLPLTGSGGTPYELLEPLWLNRAEVLRGANGFERGALALGGAVDYITRSGFDAPRLQLRMEAGSDGYLKRHIASGQVIGDLDYYVGITDMHYDGQQDHAAGSGKGVVANVGLQLTPDLETRFYLRYRETEHQSPGRLTQSQIDDDPTQDGSGKEGDHDDPREQGRLLGGAQQVDRPSDQPTGGQVHDEVANGNHERRTTGDGGHGFGNGKRHARSEDPGYRCRPDHVLKLRQCPEPGGAPGRPSHYGCQPDLPATASSTTSYNRPARAFPVGESASTTR